MKILLALLFLALPVHAEIKANAQEVSGELACAVGLPDVIITSLTYSNGIFTSAVKNQGEAATPVCRDIGVKYSVDGLTKTWGSVPGPLASGASVVVGMKGAAYVIPPGNHTVTALVDDVNRFKETNKDNNFKSIVVGATIPVPPAVPPSVSDIQGFGKQGGTTGGAGGKNIVVTNCNADNSIGSLRSAVATNATRNITFKPGLTCTITWKDKPTYVDYPNMTIDGAGAHITISGMSISIHKSAESAISNVIIRNLTFANNLPDRQAILMDMGSSNVWIDHNTFFNNSVGYTGQGVYISDNTGRGTPTYSTVSWNHFKTPNVKSTVIGQRVSKTPSGIRTSYHHNWFDGVEARNPKVAGEGVIVHFWNNLITNWGEYGSGINDGANFWAENNIYETNKVSKLAIVPDYGVPSTGPNATYWPAKSVKATGNMLVPANLSVRTLGAFPTTTIAYNYLVEPANAALKVSIQAGAGAR
jgi:pectate lyase